MKIQLPIFDAKIFDVWDEKLTYLRNAAYYAALSAKCAAFIEGAA